MGFNHVKCMTSGKRKKYRNFNFRDIRPLRTLYEQLNIVEVDSLISVGMTVWKLNFFDLEFRQFAFKMTQGLIHGNTVLSHFADVDRKCSFCKIEKNIFLKEELGRDPTANEWEQALALLPDENRLHIFWECPVVQRCLKEIYFFMWGVRNVDKTEFLLGKLGNNRELTLLYQISNLLIRQKMWNYKLAGVLPKTSTIANYVKTLLTNLCRKPDWRGMMPLLQALVV